MGKGRQLAKTEIEKLKFSELTAREAVIEAARMYVIPCKPKHNWNKLTSEISIYLVHDDAKDKDFELELTWISPESGGLHVPVPTDLAAQAERQAKASLETFEYDET